MLRSAARVFLRSTPLRPLTTALAVAACLLTLLEVGMSAAALVPQQKIERELGTYAAQYELGELTLAQIERIPDGPHLAASISASRAMLVLEEPAVPVSSPIQGSAAAREADWRSNPFPDRYQQISGRMPTSAGEVSITEDLRREVHGDTIQIYSGIGELTIVGTVRDVYGTKARTLLMGAGTVRALAKDKTLASRFPGTSFLGRLLFDSRNPSTTVERVQASLAAPKEKASQLMDRASLESAGQETLAGRSIFFSLFPRLGVPALLTLALVLHARQRLRETAVRLVSLGMSRGSVRAGVVAATWWRTSLGVLIGWTAALVLSPAVHWLMRSLLTRPPAPWSLPPAPLGILGSALLGGVATLSSVGAARQDPSSAAKRTWRVPAEVLRWGSLALFALAWFLHPDLNQPASVATFSVVLLGALACLLPDLLGWWARRPARGSRSFLNRRLVQLYPWRVVGTAAVIACAITVPANTLVLLHTDVELANAGQYDMAAPGQVIVTPSGASGLNADPAIVATVQRATGISPVQNHLLGRAPDRGFWESQDHLQLTSGNRTALLAVGTPEDAAQLLQRELTEPERALLKGGGMLTFSKSAPAVVIGSSPESGIRVPTLETSAPRSMVRGYAGVVLTSVALRHGARAFPAETFFNGLSDEQIREAKDSVVAAHFDPHTLDVPSQPDPFRIPLPWLVPPAATALLAMALVWALLQGQLKALGRASNQLLGVGAPRGWLRGVMLQQVLTVTMAGLLVALPCILLPVQLRLANRQDGETVVIPWDALGMAAATLALIVGLVTLLASARLRPQDRLR